MKVSEAMNQIKIGDDVWVKAKVAAVDQEYDFNPIAIKFFSDEIWLHEKDEISLTKPKSELIEVPQFVAELLDYYKGSTDVDLLDMLVSFNAWHCRQDKNGEHEEAINWLVKNPEKFMRAWMDGYTVKQEPKYYILLPKLGEGNGVRLWKDNTGVIYTSGLSYLSVEEKSRFTEREIKSIDERYWAFAVPVDGSVEEV